jgi:predicted nuclease of predicted toxin-antitoxin system
MRLLANENFPGPAVAALRAVGHDVLWAWTDMAGCPDEQILQRAQADRRVLLTFDKDFGNLAFHANLPAECGVLLFRIIVSLCQGGE